MPTIEHQSNRIKATEIPFSCKFDQYYSLNSDLKMFRWIFTVLFLHLQTTDGTEFRLDSALLNNSSFLEGYYNISEFRVSRFGRVSYGLNWEFELFIDFDEKVYLEIEIAWRRSNAYSFIKLLYHCKRLSFPNFHQYYFAVMKPFLDGFKNHSNFPTLEYGQPYIWKKVRIIHDIPLKKIKTAIITISGQILG